MQGITQKRLKEVLTYRKTTGKFLRNYNFYRFMKGSEAGSTHQRGYVHIGIDGEEYKAHRLAFLYVTGQWPKHGVDHKNGDKSDNKWNNLRDVSQVDNNKNAKKRKDNVSGCTGVHWCNTHERWKVQIGHGAKRKYIGSFIKLGDAIKARKKADKKYGYHRRHGGGV